MIFITLGSQKFQFNRLLKEIDRLIEIGVIKEEVFAQIGYSDYEPVNFSYERFLDRESYSEWEKKADVVITHGGTGAIIGAVKAGKRVIAVPRLAKYGEHVDNHQVQLLKQFKSQQLICGLEDCSELENVIKKIYNMNFNKYQSQTKNLLEAIDKYIQNV